MKRPAAAAAAHPSPRRRGPWLLALATLIVVLSVVLAFTGREIPSPTSGSRPAESAAALRHGATESFAAGAGFTDPVDGEIAAGMNEQYRSVV